MGIGIQSPRVIPRGWIKLERITAGSGTADGGNTAVMKSRADSYYLLNVFFCGSLGTVTSQTHNVVQ